MKSFAASLALAATAAAQDSIFSGTGFGTYYYDMEQTTACGADFSLQNQGVVGCNDAALSLNDIDSQYLVAMNNTQLRADQAGLCGRKVQVTVNGVVSDLPLFIGDGCQRCEGGSPDQAEWDPIGAPGLDFSYTVAMALSDQACNDGHLDISWEILDETLYNFDTNAPGEPTGPVGGNSTRRAVEFQS